MCIKDLKIEIEGLKRAEEILRRARQSKEEKLRNIIYGKKTKNRQNLTEKNREFSCASEV